MTSIKRCHFYSILVGLFLAFLARVTPNAVIPGEYDEILAPLLQGGASPETIVDCAIELIDLEAYEPFRTMIIDICFRDLNSEENNTLILGLVLAKSFESDRVKSKFIETMLEENRCTANVLTTILRHERLLELASLHVIRDKCEFGDKEASEYRERLKEPTVFEDYGYNYAMEISFLTSYIDLFKRQNPPWPFQTREDSEDLLLAPAVCWISRTRRLWTSYLGGQSWHSKWTTFVSDDILAIGEHTDKFRETLNADITQLEDDFALLATPPALAFVKKSSTTLDGFINGPFDIYVALPDESGFTFVYPPNGRLAPLDRPRSFSADLVKNMMIAIVPVVNGTRTDPHEIIGAFMCTETVETFGPDFRRLMKRLYLISKVKRLAMVGGMLY